MSKIKQVRIGPVAVDSRTATLPVEAPLPFYLSVEWRALVSLLIRTRGRQCQQCYRRHCRIFGDHIHELKDGGVELDPRNIMLLCGSCHTFKTNKVRAKRSATIQLG